MDTRDKGVPVQCSKGLRRLDIEGFRDQEFSFVYFDNRNLEPTFFIVLIGL